MALTSIGNQKTPARPVEITFAAQGGLPNPNQILCLVGHMGPTGGAAVSGVASGTAVPYEVIALNNSGDATLGGEEAAAKFGDGSELAKMVVAAIKANEDAGNANFPLIKCVPLRQVDTDYGALNAGGIPAALASADKIEAEFLVGCYDGEDDIVHTQQLVDRAQAMSGASRVQNGQYGTFAVAANLDTSDPSTLHKYDTQFFIGAYLRDTSVGGSANPYSPAELAAACAGLLGGNLIPFNPVDRSEVGAVTAPVKMSDYLTIGGALESESVLNRGWTPLQVLPNGTVAVVRSVTARLTVDADGVTFVTAYYDVQDFQVLYFFRKAVATRLNQPDLVRVKASSNVMKLIKGELIALAKIFEDQGMFQSVDQLAKLFQIERNASDRSRFDVFIPVNVVPGLHMVAVNEQATTQFDVFTV